MSRELSINHEAQIYTREDLFGFIMFLDSSANPRTFVRIQGIRLRFRIENLRKYNQTGTLLPVFWIYIFSSKRQNESDTKIAERSTLLEETSRYLPWVFSKVNVSQEIAFWSTILFFGGKRTYPARKRLNVTKFCLE